MAVILHFLANQKSRMPSWIEGKIIEHS